MTRREDACCTFREHSLCTFVVFCVSRKNTGWVACVVRVVVLRLVGVWHDQMRRRVSTFVDNSRLCQIDSCDRER